MVMGIRVQEGFSNKSEWSGASCCPTVEMRFKETGSGWIQASHFTTGLTSIQ